MKHALVTGGTKGIGKQIVLDLLNKDYFVYTNYGHDENGANIAKRDFENVSNNFLILKVNQSDRNEVLALIDIIQNLNCILDVLVLNTGVTFRGEFLKIEASDWDDVFNVNLYSSFQIIKGLYNKLSEGSSVVFIGSLMALYPHSLSVLYGVSKAAVVSLAKNLVKEFVPRRIRVNILVPGFVRTDWQKDKSEDLINRIGSKIAAGRFAETYEISHACMFLIENSYINGATLVVDGGYCFE